MTDDKTRDRALGSRRGQEPRDEFAEMFYGALAGGSTAQTAIRMGWTNGDHYEHGGRMAPEPEKAVDWSQGRGSYGNELPLTPEDQAKHHLRERIEHILGPHGVIKQRVDPNKTFYGD